ncbi:9461_t:CDS:1, partial [Dentiscutata heterogama]
MVIGEKVYKLKKGTYIMSNIYAIHHEKDSLLKFDPSRFLNKNDDLCFVLFGIGGRSCPGKSIGLSMVKIFVANFLINNLDYEILTKDKDKPNFGLQSTF